jgi:hypothetical protein
MPRPSPPATTKSLEIPNIQRYPASKNFLTLDERQNNVALRPENFVPRETNASPSFLGGLVKTSEPSVVCGSFLRGTHEQMANRPEIEVQEPEAMSFAGQDAHVTLWRQHR